MSNFACLLKTCSFSNAHIIPNPLLNQTQWERPTEDENQGVRGGQKLMSGYKRLRNSGDKSIDKQMSVQSLSFKRKTLFYNFKLVHFYIGPFGIFPLPLHLSLLDDGKESSALETGKGTELDKVGIRRDTCKGMLCLFW
jgi:hypothetical protein